MRIGLIGRIGQTGRTGQIGRTTQTLPAQSSSSAPQTGQALSQTAPTVVQALPAPPTVQTATVSAVQDYDSETQQTVNRTTTRNPGLRSRPGLIGAFLGTLCVLSMFGRSEGLPLESKNEKSISDVLDVFHENCLASLAVHEHSVLFDSGAAAHCCRVPMLLIIHFCLQETTHQNFVV